MSKKVSFTGALVLLSAFAFVRWHIVHESTESSSAGQSTTAAIKLLVRKDGEFPKTNAVLISKKETDGPFGIAFPDGEHITVTLRQTPYRFPTGITSLANEYGRLVEDALNGNVATARYLYKTLRQCSRPDFANEADLEAGIAELWQSDSYTTSDGKKGRFRVGTGDKEEAEEILRQEFAFCDGVDQRHLSEKDRWQEFAIENGDMRTVLEYADRLPRSSPERVAMYKKAFELGSINAAGHVAAAYQNGWEGHEPDLVQAYAYAYIYAKLFQASAPKKYQRNADYLVNQIVNTMPPYQMDEAMALAKVLAKSPGCCEGRPFKN